MSNNVMQELTRAEEQVMQILWEKGKGFVKEILEDFPEPKPAYNTVSTIIRILETKGFVNHRAFGKTHEYFPIVSKEAYRKQISKTMLNNYFDGNPRELVSYFVKEKKLNIKDLDDIIKLMNKK